MLSEQDDWGYANRPMKEEAESHTASIFHLFIMLL
jgi:hypothetical protein